MDLLDCSPTHSLVGMLRAQKSNLEDSTITLHKDFCCEEIVVNKWNRLINFKSGVASFQLSTCKVLNPLFQAWFKKYCRIFDQMRFQLFIVHHKSLGTSTMK
eukprot:Gregarina_sp_Poly_1__10923@NODE_855_length_5952_cov_168_906542_g618_i0_p3_GENE_NODE_855_length_5952_cov_168_906542_g618_i0NODE_855_length_5952_cov_168_906542_g618_i0_p3_ORF_typecomplete_len102_score4_76_NODE_855_length_5952_cov_168_906542_g618_i077382